MFIRNILLAVGAVFVLAGIGLMIAWFGQARKPATVVETRVESRAAVLVAANAIPKGKFLRQEDFKSKDLGPGEVLQPGSLVPGQEKDFLNALVRRDFAQGEPLIASDFVKPGDQRFLAAVLKPGSRAISIFVDAAQSVSGLALPGDYVDVILTQSFDEKVTKTQTITYQGVSQTTTDERPMAPFGRKVAGETVLHEKRVIAVDQSLNPPSPVVAIVTAVSTEARIPKTVTLELTERDAETLLVAAKLGSFQLAVLPLAAVGEEVLPEENRKANAVWAWDASAAIREIPPSPPEPQSCDPKTSLTGSTLECSVRRPFRLSYYNAPLASAVIAPNNIERRPPGRGPYD